MKFRKRGGDLVNIKADYPENTKEMIPEIINERHTNVDGTKKRN